MMSSNPPSKLPELQHIVSNDEFAYFFDPILLSAGDFILN